MTEHQMLTAVDAGVLAEAFPMAFRSEATRAAEGILKHMHERQWTDRFVVVVGGEPVSIPYRLHFVPGAPNWDETGASTFGRCLEARSSDGFQRQRAARWLLAEVQPWSAPFIVALIGEYLVEILQDIHEALTPRSCATLADFICENPGYWQLTRQRVMSYWNVYYRMRARRSDYIGFKLLDTLGGEARVRAGG